MSAHEHLSPQQFRGLDKKTYTSNYSRGWKSAEGGIGGLERADSRREHNSWYDGYMDNAAGREKFHSRDCPNRDHGQCP